MSSMQNGSGNFSNNAKYSFLYLLALLSLFFVILGAGQVLFQIINNLLPEENIRNFSIEVLRFGLSFLLVGSPVLFFTTRTINADIKNEKYSLDGGVRRWFTYFTILIASVIAVIDLVFGFYNFLSGELTLRISLKIITILFLSGFTILYYTKDIMRKDLKLRNFFLFDVIYIISVAATFIAGIFFSGSPASARHERLDGYVIRELQSIHWKLEDYFQKNNSLPKSLETLVDEKIVFPGDLSDEKNNKPYQYTRESKNRYQLCAEFRVRADEKPSEANNWNPDWQHGKGQHCFQKTVLKYRS